MKNKNQVTYLFQGNFLPLPSWNRWYDGFIGWSCQWNDVSWKWYNNNECCKLKNPSANNLMDRTLPCGGVMLVWIEETTDAMIELAGSVVCSCALVDVSSSWGASCGWGGDGACCVWASGEEGDDSTWIADPGGGGGAAVFWRFACDLVLLGPFLFIWLDWGASAVVLVLLVFADLPVCWYNDKSFISTSVTEYWWNFGWSSESYRWSSHGSRCILKRPCEYRMESVEIEEIKTFNLENLRQSSSSDWWRCLGPLSGDFLEAHTPVH